MIYDRPKFSHVYFLRSRTFLYDHSITFKIRKYSIKAMILSNLYSLCRVNVISQHKQFSLELLFSPDEIRFSISAFRSPVSGFVHSGRVPQLYLSFHDLDTLTTAGNYFIEWAMFPHAQSQRAGIQENRTRDKVSFSGSITSRGTWCPFFLLVTMLTLITCLWYCPQLHMLKVTICSLCAQSKTHF